MTISSDPSAIDRTFTALRAEGRSGLVPYLTAGFPTVDASRDALRAAAEHCDILEVGVPFSDPVADGPTIQASTFQALANGMTLPRTLELIHQADVQRPVVLFSYLNPVLQYGIDRLLVDAAAIGVSGILLTDLPAGTDPAFESTIGQSPLDLIRLVAPTTRADRLARAVAGAEGFIYLVARLGVTGASRELATGLAENVARLRDVTPLPIAVGFGISTPDQARAVAGLADGVVVGSALVDVLGAEGVPAAARFLAGLRSALDGR
ncbi:MAG TPA: tryptophan synthase subunit alpha [Gemmatimonadales bacterium]|nr:tryptophan synthase subunit alpha [Gemmatimonadales bacterium]